MALYRVMCDMCDMRVVTEMKQRTNANATESSNTKNKGSCGRWMGQIHRTCPSRSTSAENRKKTEQILRSTPNRSTRLDLHRGWSQRCRFLRHVPPDNTTTLRMSTSHFTRLWKEVSWNPRFLPVKLGWKTFTQKKRSAPQLELVCGCSCAKFLPCCIWYLYIITQSRTCCSHSLNNLYLSDGSPWLDKQSPRVGKKFASSCSHNQSWLICLQSLPRLC